MNTRSYRIRTKTACFAFLVFYFLLSGSVSNTYAQTQTIPVPKPGASTIKLENIDQSVYTEWVDGVEKPVQGRDDKSKLPQWVLWTDKSEPSYSGVLFGASKKTGPRHLRIGFNSPVAIGSLLTEGGGRPSVLKPGAAYPGNMNDESQWIPAQRIVNGRLSDREADKSEYALWTFPPGTKTRAIRFSHLPESTDLIYEGILIGAYIMEERLTNIASQASPFTKSNNKQAGFLTNGLDDGWRPWGNIDEKDIPTEVSPVITKNTPEWILLTWTKPVQLSALCVLWTGFNTAEVQTYTGPVGLHPRDARENQWQTITDYSGIFAIQGRLWPNFLPFGRTVTTTAIRLKITSATKDKGNMEQRTLGGKRTWLGEVMALQPLAALPLQVSAPTQAEQIPNAPIAIPFTLEKGGYVTLVIEDKNGMRIRNLISETWFNAGKNTAYWDGLDDLGRDVQAAKHGLYKIPSKFVAPGEYKVRGLVRGKITTSYEFSVYTTGTPPWSTDDHTGAWLANHTAPQAALFVPAKDSPTGQPAVCLGNYLSEGPDGFAVVDLDGKKLIGKKSVGEFWTAAPYLARDAGEKAIPGFYAYAACVWETGKKSGEGNLRITALTADKDKQILLHLLGPLVNEADKIGEIGGFAVNNGIGVVSMTKRNQLLFIDMKAGQIVGTSTLDAPKGLAFDSKGSLLAISSNKLLRLNVTLPVEKTASTKNVITSGLEAPVGITLDEGGKLYISDGGTSHQVKVFTPEGKFIRAIGKPGVPKAGPYDQLHMNNPAGLAIDSRQHLWVAENDFIPKRVSVWTLDGAFVKAFYGPGKYGGGGTLDPQDKSKFYYADETKGSMEFSLDWKTGEYKLQNILYRKSPENLKLAFRSAGPETPLYYKGKRYFTNCHNSSPTSGHATAFLFIERNGIAYPAVAMGKAESWDELKQDKFKALLPEGVDLNSKKPEATAFFLWVDKNEDSQVQPEEVTIQKGAGGGVTIMNDLSFTLGLNGKAIQLFPTGTTANGVPLYKLDEAKVLVEGVVAGSGMGGNQILTTSEGQTVVVQGILPFNIFSICGTKDGKAVWSYPNMWPGLHASHEAPLPGFPGQLIGPTRLLGGLMEMKGSESGPLWAINSNHGMVYVFTSDGLFVATLFQPMRAGKRWRMPVAERGMNMDEMTLGEENFWPTITQTTDGEIYILDGGRNSLVKVDGLKDIKRLPYTTINVTADDLLKSRDYQAKAEAMRQKTQGKGILNVTMRTKPISIDGKLEDWADAEWVEIDKSGVRANFNSNSRPYNVTGAVAVEGNRLCVAYKTGEPDLLKNSGEMPTAPFKTGGALDLMIGADPNAKADRQAPVAGDIRLLVTIIKGKTQALLYRAVVSGTKLADKVPFSSPWRTISFDKVEDVSSQLSFAKSKDGDYEISLPLAVLGLKPVAGMSIKGDIGILRGDGTQTFARVYWSNKGTGIVSDVPEEAQLAPALWGDWLFEASK
ncbi:MAG: hypothetical protein PHS30_04400 [Bacteroidales bacterium]|nr:hypothetical protein [Bacteroidales bacterium]